MYFSGALNGFKREFTVKYSYFIILIWMLSGFIKNLVMVFSGFFNPHFGAFYYIFLGLGALVASWGSAYLLSLALKEKKVWYYIIYNIILAFIVFVIWIRG